MLGTALKYLLLTSIPVPALGAPAASPILAPDTAAMTADNTACGTTSISSTSYSASETAHSSSSAQPTQNSCGQWVVPGTGAFSKKIIFTFTGSTLPAGLSASDYEVNDQSGGAPYNHVFHPANVAVSDGFLNLKVPGGQLLNAKTAISSAEVTTNVKMLYGSVRTKAIFSTVPGTCHGNFFYKSDNEEIDIEYLTNSSSTSNPVGQGMNQPPWLQYTNQPLKAGEKPTYATGNPPANVAVVHEYRVDWIPGKTMFFLDGVLQKTFTTNVPTKAGPWVWNNYANGDPNWTVGPPTQDNVFKIQSISMYYNEPEKMC